MRPGTNMALMNALQHELIMNGWIDDAAQGAKDTGLLADVRRCHEQTQTQLAWLRTQLANSTAQAMVVA